MEKPQQDRKNALPTGGGHEIEKYVAENNEDQASEGGVIVLFASDQVLPIETEHEKRD